VEDIIGIPAMDAPRISAKNGINIEEVMDNCVFSVMCYGRVINVKVTKPYDKLLDAEAVRVVSMSPRWKPMRINGKGVMSNYTLDVNFKLTK
jgi:hypothetical protein